MERNSGYRPVSYNNHKNAAKTATRSNNLSRHQQGEYLETPQNAQRSANGAAGGGGSEVSPSNSNKNRGGEPLRGFSGIMGKDVNSNIYPKQDL